MSMLRTPTTKRLCTKRPIPATRTWRNYCASTAATNRVKPAPSWTFISQIWRATAQRSQIAEPPIAPSFFQPCEPKAQRIEQRYHGKPHCIYNPERVTVVRWIEVRGSAHRGGRIQQKRCLVVSNESE